jgi:protoheme IX farnesyltransferase
MASTATTGSRASAREWRAALSGYAALTKPRIVGLLVVTTIPAMVLAEGGWPALWLMIATVVGGSVMAGGANALNMYFDRDIDEMMKRTSRRPVPAGSVEPEKAALLGLVMGVLGFALLYVAVNPLAAFLTLGAYLFYVVVYTLILKRKTSLNIVIGGAAGAMPPVIGWAAVTGSVGIEAVLMFLIITLWTPPHFWALSINYATDYERAKVPMLPVVAGPEETKRQILWYSLALVATTLALLPLSDLGVLYGAAALALGAAFVHRAVVLWRSLAARESMTLFRFSIVYLGGIFAAILVDALIQPA